MTILSHAGLLVESGGRQLVCDPWLVGSCYWRSWWNYPPVADELVRSLRPDWVYLTHVHWDHFHGPTLKRFRRDMPILIPFDRCTRVRDDLRQMGFTEVVELRHGRRTRLADDLTVTSYHFGPALDSALVVECDGVTILNANDAKFMGGPLDQILRRHPRIDFALRSHSSANARLSFHVIGKPDQVLDDAEAYGRSFCDFMARVRPRYAIPFASNHCHLHRDTWDYNRLVVSPLKIAEDFARYRRRRSFDTELVVMTSGDSWDSRDGFHVTPSPFLADREGQLGAYAAAKAPSLERTYRLEERARVREALIADKLAAFARSVPWFLRRRFRGRPILFEATAGARRETFLFDLQAGTVKAVADGPDFAQTMRIVIPAFVLRQALAMNMFGHAAISKRVHFHATEGDMPALRLLESLFFLYEYDCLPLRRLPTRRLVTVYAARWRELLLYARLALGLAFGVGLQAQQTRLLGGLPAEASETVA